MSTSPRPPTWSTVPRLAGQHAVLEPLDTVHAGGLRAAVTLGCVNVSFETSWLNHASRTAIARLGAKQDGVLRNAKRHADGSRRDTVVFSILDTEWPAVRSNLQYRLESHQ